MTQLPLKGKRIVVTRTRQQAGALSRGLEALGAVVVELPTIEIFPPESYEPLDAALLSLNAYQWLIVTSANAVRVLGERLALLGVPVSALAGLRIAAVGPATRDALTQIGVSAPSAGAQDVVAAQDVLSGEDVVATRKAGLVVPAEYVAESLVNALRDQVCGARVLLARASVARDVIPDELRRLGAEVVVVDAYRTGIPEGSAAAVRVLFGGAALAEGGLKAGEPRAGEFEAGVPLPDAVTFTSSSTVKHFSSLLREAGVGLPAGLRALSIGPVTSATLREYGWEPAVEAGKHDVEGLLAAAVRALGAVEPGPVDVGPVPLNL